MLEKVEHSYLSVSKALASGPICFVVRLLTWPWRFSIVAGGEDLNTFPEARTLVTLATVLNKIQTPKRTRIRDGREKLRIGTDSGKDWTEPKVVGVEAMAGETSRKCDWLLVGTSFSLLSENLFTQIFFRGAYCCSRPIFLVFGIVCSLLSWGT